jgi:AAA+ superfamily predicted ATPase
MSETFDELVNLTQAGASVIHLASFEWERIQALARRLAEKWELSGAEIWSSSMGLEKRGSGETSVPDSSADPVGLLKELYEGNDEPRVILFEDFHPYLEMPRHHEVVRWVRQLTRADGNPPRVALLSTPTSELPEDLQKEVPTLEVPLPNKKHLEKLCGRVARRLSEKFDGFTFNEHSEKLFEAAQGLTTMEAELAFGKAGAECRKLTSEESPVVMREKKRILRENQMLEYYEPEVSFDDVGGLGKLQEWLQKRKRAYGDKAQDFGLEPPRGTMLLGVQGCGKSLIAKAIAQEWSFPLLRFDIGKVFGGIVGESESNMRKALEVAEALAPSVLWIDEIEKGLSGLGSSGATDGGTTARVFGTFLTWMQEKDTPVFVVATANRIQQLPPELLRKGRFDELFFVDLPGFEDRKDILSIHLKAKDKDPDRFDLEMLAQKAQGFSGAEIEEAIHEGMFTAFDDGTELADEHIATALEETVPLARTMAEDIKQLREWAEVRARPASGGEPGRLPESSSETPRLKQERQSIFLDDEGED